MSHPTSKQGNEPTDQVIHVYDGIEEQDNHLPRWWLATFFGAIVFSGLYIGYYWLGDGPSINEEFASERTAISAKVAAHQAAGGEYTESVILTAANDKDQDGRGNTLFQARCASCHGTKAEGGIGPNLTDKAWLHGKEPKNWLSVIRNGVLDKGMPPWDSAFTKQELLSLVGYIAAVQGSNPPNAKAPQGQE